MRQGWERVPADAAFLVSNGIPATWTGSEALHKPCQALEGLADAAIGGVGFF